PFKKKLDEYLNYQEKLIRRMKIDLRLNTAVTPELAEALSPDVIIAALGAEPVKPKIPGIDGKNVISAEAAYINPAPLGKNVVILGAGLVGTELGIYLSMLGRHVEIVEMADTINDGGNFLHASGLRREIKLR